MIVAAAFLPHPPVLVPDAARAAAPELADLRMACRAAVQTIAMPGRRLAIVGAGERDEVFGPKTSGTLAGFGVDITVALGPDPDDEALLPLALTVGAWLVRDALGPDAAAIGVAVTGGRSTLDLDDDDAWAVLVMGDGSARRSTAAPGYLDDRAEDFDAAVVAALAGGRGAALTASQVDPGLGGELLAAGVPVWNAVGATLDARTFTAEVLYDAAPYGVGYFVATWT